MQKLKYLLKAELYKHKSLGFIRFYCIIMLIVGVGSALPYLLDTDTTTLDWFLIYNNLLANPITINLIITGMAAMYHIKDINDKSIHHVITSGYTKGQAILSRIISISIISSFAYLLYIFAGVGPIYNCFKCYLYDLCISSKKCCCFFYCCFYLMDISFKRTL
jgi:ABC-type transport system involved in multi-copper enzyme maturation permease subunit